MVLSQDIIEQVLGDTITYVVKNAYRTQFNDVYHVYLKQTMNGMEIFNADLNINMKDGQALSLGHSFYSGPATTQTGTYTAIQAAAGLAAFLRIELSLDQLSQVDATDAKHLQIAGFPGALSPVRARSGYIQTEQGLLEPVWDLEVDLGEHWYNARVSSNDATVMSLYDWVSDLNTYTVFPLGVDEPTDGNRSQVVAPAVFNASPLGWHDQGLGRVFTDTRGNNAYCQENWSGRSTGWENNQRPNGTATNDYNFPLDLNATDARSYINASVTNLFYWNNIIHDIFYQYGFDEVSGNFQENNFNRGGKDTDAVQANAQDGSGTNNANFATPPDGQRPRMRMYLFTITKPSRDGDFENGIITHEYAHGISTRLTGGPSNVNCLFGGESGGMGEGWGDFFSNSFRQRPNYNRNMVFPEGDWVLGNTKGVRQFPYTTNMSINPDTYAWINNASYGGVHAKGAVWCAILWEVYWNAVDALGFSSNWYQGEGGNNQLLRDVVDGMKLQPCDPNFVEARDAILQADRVNFGGKNICLYWRGFAKRGLGLNAVGTGDGRTKVIESFTVPSECM